MSFFLSSTFRAVFTLAIALVVSTVAAVGQAFLRSEFLPSNNRALTVPQIQKAANDYFQAHPEKAGKKGSGWKQFKRWEWYWEQRTWGNGGKLPAQDHDWKEWGRYVEKNGAVLASSANSAGQWKPLGPTTAPARGWNGLGRLNCIEFHPTDPNTFWVGSPAGGLWKTTDFGATWRTITDNLPVLGVSDIAVHPNDPNIIYIATGDGDMGSLTSLTGMEQEGDTKSIGVLRTTNGGYTWETTGLMIPVQQSVLIRRLAMNPAYPNVLLAATSAGMYMTIDGGATWSLTLADYMMDIEFHPTNPAIVYATSYNDPRNGTTAATFYRSEDGGMTWTPTVNLEDVIRMKIGVTPAQPNRVDILCAGKHLGLYGIFASLNTGINFNSGYVPDTLRGRPNLLGWYHGMAGYDFQTGQGQYDLAYAISPQQPYEMYVGGVNTWRTTDAGLNWETSNVWSDHPEIHAMLPNPTDVAHADKHWLKFHPLKPEYLFECNDGGLWYSSDRGRNWHNLSSGLQIGQIYRIAGSATEEGTIIAGHQDNTTMLLQNGVWKTAIGGDGMDCVIDHTNPNIMYGSYANGKIYRSYNRYADPDDTNDITIISTNIPGYGKDFQGAWVTPYAMDPFDSKTLYVGMNQVWKTTDRGDSWQAISPRVFSRFKTDSEGNPRPLNLRSLAVAPSNPNVIYVATFEDISVTTNGGQSWQDMNAFASEGESITYIAVDPENPGLLFISISGYNAGSKVYAYDLSTHTLLNISRNLPNVPANCVAVDTKRGRGLYVGTDLGVFYLDLLRSFSAWQPFNDGMPIVPVTDLEIHEASGKLRAATFGRGAWETLLPEYVPSAVPQTTDQPADPALPSVASISDDGMFQLTVPTLAHGEKAIIYDYLGKAIMEIPVAANEQMIDLRLQPASIYYLALGSQRGSQRPIKLVKAK